MFRWTKDYNLAAGYFEDAAKLYKASKMWEKEISALKYAIECNVNLHDNWAVARNYEGIISSWIDNNPELSVAELVELTRNVLSFAIPL